MTKNRVPMIFALLLAMTAMSFAQGLQVGDKFPKIPTEELINTKMKAAKDFKGKLLLVEFFAHW